MIKPNELRLGNLLCFNGVVHTVSVSFLEYLITPRSKLGNGDTHTVHYLDGLYKKHEPIPLTEEWLVKAGFQDKGLNVFRHNEAMLELLNVNNHYFRGYYKGSSGIVADIKHVHQLQNLYHALTGTELTFDV